jgi:hypothetical protein
VLIEADFNARGDEGRCDRSSGADSQLKPGDTVEVLDREAAGTVTARVTAVHQDAGAVLLEVDWDSFTPRLVQRKTPLVFGNTGLSVPTTRRVSLST